MQDKRTGELHEINQKDIMKELDLASNSAFSAEEAMRKSMESRIPRQFQSNIFYVGEELEIKGAKFRVKNFGKKFVMLEGISSF